MPPSTASAAEVSTTDLAAASEIIREIDNQETRNSAIGRAVSASEKTIANQLPEALRLLDELPNVHQDVLLRLATKISPADSADYRAWVENAQAAGRIEYPFLTDPEMGDADQMRQAKEYNDRIIAEKYQELLLEIENRDR